MAEPLADDLLEALGDAELVDREVRGPAAVAVEDGARLGEVAKHLLDEERVALGLVVYGACQLGLRLAARPRADQGLHGAFVEPVEGKPLELVLLPMQVGEGLGEMVGPVLLRLPVGPDDQQPRLVRRASEVLEQRERRLVGPMKVVENQHDRRLGRLLGQQRRHRLEEQEALGVGLSFRCLRKVGKALRELRQAGARAALCVATLSSR